MNNTKSLNIRFTVAHVKAMNDLVNAGLYTSIADLVRASVRDLLMREYFGRESEIENLMLKKGTREETYGQGDRAKGYKASQKALKPKSSVAEGSDAEESEAEAAGPVGIGGPVTSSGSVPTIEVEEDSSEREDA